MKGKSERGEQKIEIPCECQCQCQSREGKSHGLSTIITMRFENVSMIWLFKSKLLCQKLRSMVVLR